MLPKRYTLKNSFFKNFFVSSFGETRAQRDLCARVTVNTFVQVNDKHVIAGTATLSDADEKGLVDFCRTLYSHDRSLTEKSDQVVTGFPKFFPKFMGLPYPYRLLPNDEFSKTLSKMHTGSWCPWDTPALQFTSSADSNTPRSGPAPYTSDVGGAEMGDELIVEMSIDLVDEDFHGKKVFVTPPDPRKYGRKYILAYHLPG